MTNLLGQCEVFNCESTNLVLDIKEINGMKIITNFCEKHNKEYEDNLNKSFRTQIINKYFNKPKEKRTELEKEILLFWAGKYGNDTNYN